MTSIGLLMRLSLLTSLHKKKKLAPGPDGIHNGVYRCAGGLGSEFLFRGCKAVLEGTKELGVLLIDLAAAYSSNDHSCIFSELVNAALLGFPCRFLRSFFRDIITHENFAGAERDNSLCTEEYGKVVLRVFSFMQWLLTDLQTVRRDYPEEEL